MNLTYIFGNGYDLQLGLKTSYKDFYASISADKKESNNIYKDIDKNPENWADFESSFGDYTKNQTEELKNDSVKSKLDDDFDEVIEDLGNYLEEEQKKLLKFEENTADLLKRELSEPFSNYPSEYERVLKEKLDSYGSENIQVSFLTLNYTNSLEVLRNDYLDFPRTINAFQRITLAPPIHLHGTCDFHLTLGVNDESQLSPHFSSEEAQAFMKPSLLEQSGETMKRDGAKQLRESDIIIIFGASLGKTDKFWWQEVANAIIKNDCMVVLHHFSKELSNRSTRKQIKKRKELENLFLSYMEDLTDDDKEKIAQNLIIVFNLELFKFGDFGKITNGD